MVVDRIESLYIDIAHYDPLAGSSYKPLPPELKHPMKGLINLKYKNNECFKWCRIRFINTQNKDADTIKKQDKEIAKTLDYRDIKFPMKAGDYNIIEERFNINVNVFGYENRVFPLYVSKKFNEQVLNVLLIGDKNDDGHYVFIKDFNRLMHSKTKHKGKKHFCMACLQNFTTKEILNSYRERCLLVNDAQAVKYETGTIKFKNFNNQKPLPFKVYADTECFNKRVNIRKGKNTKLCQKHVPNSIGAKLAGVDSEFTLPTKLLLLLVVIVANNFFNGFLSNKSIQIK